MPPLPIAAFPTSNWGLTSSTQKLPGSAWASAGGRASLSDMKLTSLTTPPIVWPETMAGGMERALMPS